MSDELTEDAPLTAEDILTFGPVVEAATWNLAWIAEKRAPIAQAAGRPKLGPVFNEQGVGKAVLIRPCQSRGRRVRGLSPIYTPTMLEANATVFTGWPMYMDHVPAELAETMAKRGRSVKELGGQVLTPWWQADFVREDDADFGYQVGGVLGEVWANDFIRRIVGENPDVLHTSISAWPTSGKPGPVPWKPKTKGMLIEGIRRQPQGSVDFVPRGGAGGRILLAEGEDPDTRAWPEPGWRDEDRALVVSLAERAYASREMSEPNFSQMSPAELRTYLTENAPHLVPALAEGAPASAPQPTATVPTPAGLTEADVKALIESAVPKGPSTDELEAQLSERFEQQLAERDEQRALAAEAARMIEVAEGIPASWKSDLKARYAMLPSGPSPALLVESETAEDGTERATLDVLRENVTADLDHARDLIAEATGKPRVTGEGGTTRRATGDERQRVQEQQTPYWRERFAEMGIVESAETALSIHGVEKVEG